MPEGPSRIGASPIRELVVKLYERCNLSCDYCYMYEGADQGWRTRPAVMADETVHRTALRLAEHAETHRLGEVRVVFHGGEPLLAGVDRMRRAVVSIRRVVEPATRVRFAVQTNGVLLSEDFLALFVEHGVRVGVSIDGGRSANDRHRRYASGRGSHSAVVTGINRLLQPAFRDVYGGLLCTIDLGNDPVETYESLLEHEPPVVDFLLPHGNWVFPPPGLDPGGSATPYADWLIAVFDRWYGAPRRETGVRLLDSIISLLLGGASSTEAVGLGIPAAVTVESDGSIEGNDALKTTAPDGAATGMTVFANSLDDVVQHESIASARRGLDSLGPQCRTCSIVSVCGGGLHAHRFSAEDGFSRPSVYCADLFRLVRHVRERLGADLATHTRQPSPMC